MKIKVISSLGVILYTSISYAHPYKGLANIIYILADDLGYGDVGCYGQKIIKTPNIDDLVQKGMLFTQHYAGCTVIAPSRSSLMTGLHTGHTFIRGNEDVNPEGQFPLPANTFTLAKMLQKAGYVTGAFGKWGLGYPGSTGDPNKMGFDEFYGYNCQKLAHNSYPYYSWHNQSKVILHGNDGFKKEQYAPDLVQQQVLHFIEQNKCERIFMYLAYTLPHAELTSPNDTIYNLYNDKIIEKESYNGVDNGEGYKVGSYGSSSTPHSDFASMVTRLDAYVGEVIKKLQQVGIERNTIIIFTSDNGPHREGGADPDFFDSYGSLRGIKRDMFEGGIRVPMIAVWSDKIKAGSISNFVSVFWDIMPTFKNIVGIKSPIKTDGISMLPTLLSKNRQKTHSYLYWEFHEQGGKIAVRMRNWKGIKLNYEKNPTAKMMLFNLKTDIHEDQDVADKYPNIVAKIEEIIKNNRTKSAKFSSNLSY